MQEPDRPRGLLEPCAATSGKHGSEEGGAGKRRPLSDDRLHWVRDMDFDEGRSRVRTASAHGSWPPCGTSLSPSCG